MTQLALSASLLLTLVAFALGLIRAMLGPTAEDRILAAQLVGSCGVGFLLIQAQVVGERAVLDVALVAALLAAVSAVAFVGSRRAGRG